jgi:hypothetical protein
MRQGFRFGTLFVLRHALLSLALLVATTADSQIVTDVTLNRETFNPSIGDGKVELRYKIQKADAVTIGVYDADNSLVVTLAENEKQPSGEHMANWDGIDFSGRAVPDGTYTFTIETASGGVFDPGTFSGGFVDDIENAAFNDDGTVVYTLPKCARVLVRLGVKNGPMLRTLVDWEPRVAGSITEYWDWKDQDKIFNLRGNKAFSALITYVELPDATIITYGNKAESYRDYKVGRGKDRPKKPVRSRVSDPTRKLVPEGFVPSPMVRAPRVAVTFPNLAESNDGVPSVQEIAMDVRVDVDPSDKDHLLSQQFEIIFFVGNVFFAEAERGYLPHNWRWELQQLPPGEHILTVNISSFKGQVGVGSRKIKVVKPEGK